MGDVGAAAAVVVVQGYGRVIKAERESLNIRAAARRTEDNFLRMPRRLPEEALEHINGARLFRSRTAL
ncbi:unnamed protein product [Gadus morhua 'NCC']